MTKNNSEHNARNGSRAAATSAYTVDVRTRLVDESGFYTAAKATVSCSGANSPARTAVRKPGAKRSSDAQNATHSPQGDGVSFVHGKTEQPAGWYDKNGRERLCDWCRQPYVAKRSTSRFCSSNCRWHAHQQRHNDSEVTK